MDRHELITKLNTITKAYLANKAKLWDIGTNIWKTWTRVIDNLQSVNFDEKSIIKIIQIDKNKYKLMLDDFNITPTVKKDKLTSQSAIRQYLQIGSGLSFIDFGNEDKIQDNSEYKILPWLLSLKKHKEHELISQFIYILICGFNHEVYFCKNLSFSLFISLIDEYDSSLFNEMDKNIIFKPHKDRNKWKKYSPLDFNNPITFKYIKRIKGDINPKDNFGYPCHNYDEVIIELLKQYEFNDLINKIYNQILNNDNLFWDLKSKEIINLEKEQKINDKLFENYINILKNERVKLRDNILNSRVNNEVNEYSDITNSSINKSTPQYMDACHIYEMQDIIRDFIEQISSEKDIENISKILNSYSKYANDYNNGLLLSKCCHMLFDKRIVWFDNDGNLKHRSDCQDIVEKYFGYDYKNIRIRQEVLNDEMKHYLKIRNQF